MGRQMDLNPEKRDQTRLEHKSSVTLENRDTGILRGACMYNYSDVGIYFEADYRLEPETEVRVGISNSPFAAEPNKSESYQGVIKWRKPLKRSRYTYGYGLTLLRESEPAVTLSRHPVKRVHLRIRVEK